ncbi:MAG: hypothetical protein KKB50_08100 [Planctomycetes bacterium]|nr:hypothetical protein [Planctomycetota bacterium]
MVWLLIPVLTVAGMLWSWQAFAFPRTGEYRELIQTADRVVVRAFLVNDEAGGIDFLELIEPADRAVLASSFRVTGLWMPLDELIANSYRIRVIAEGRPSDIVIRGDRVRSGTVWHARIDRVLFDTIEDLVRDHGGNMPDWRALAHLPHSTTEPSTQSLLP